MRARGVCVHITFLFEIKCVGALVCGVRVRFAREGISRAFFLHLHSVCASRVSARHNMILCAMHARALAKYSLAAGFNMINV